MGGDRQSIPKPTDKPTEVQKAQNEPARVGDTPQHAKPDVVDGGRVDPNRAIDISQQQFGDGKDKNAAIQQHKDSTSTTGYANQRSITDANGVVRKGIESFDKTTNQRMFYEQQKDGSFKQYQVTEGGRNLQPVDQNGKAAGEAIRVRNNQAENPGKGTDNPATKNPETKNPNARDGGDKSNPENTRGKNRSAEPGTDGVRPETPGGKHNRPEGQHPDRPEGGRRDRPEGGKDNTGTEPGKNFKPEVSKFEGTPKTEGKTSEPNRPENWHGKNQDRPTTSTDNSGENRGPRTREERERTRNSEPEVTNRRPIDTTPSSNPTDNGVKHRRLDGNDNGGGQDNGGRGPRNNDDGGRRNNPGDYNRPNVNNMTPEQIRNTSPEGRRQLQETRNENGGDRHDARLQARIEHLQNIQQQPGQRPGDFAARAADGRQLDGRQFVRPDGVSRADIIARAELQERGLLPGKLTPGAEARLITDLHNPGHRSAMLDMLNKFDQGKLGGQGREGDMQAFLKGLRPNEIRGLKDFLSLDGKQTGPNFLKLDGRSQVQLQEMLTLTGRTGRVQDGVLDTGARLNTARTIDFLASREMLDKVPSADQSRLILKELFSGKDMNGQKSILNGSQEQLNLTRTLGQRELDAAGKMNFVMKGDQIQVTRDLMDKIASKDVLTTRLEAGRTDIAQARITDLSNTTLDASSRLVDRTNAASTAAADLAIQKSVTDAKLDASNKPIDATRTAAEIATNAAAIAQAQAVRSAETALDQSNKYGMPEDKNQLNLAAEKAKQKEKEKDNDKPETAKNQLTPEEMAVLLARKLKEEKDRAAKEKEKASEQTKKDPTKRSRTRYRIRQNDTLHGIALRFLQDENLAAAIYHLNRTVIPLSTHGGKSFANPQINTLVWLPGDEDIEMFKNSGGAKKYAHIGFKGAKYGSAEEELQARYGSNWKIEDSDNSTASSAAIASNTRRSNIEMLLGPFQTAKDTNGRIKYTARLGDSLKSVALKHPALQQVELWKLVAAVNGLSTQTDSRGTPIDSLSRGMVIDLPSQQEIDHFQLTGQTELPARSDDADSDSSEDTNSYPVSDDESSSPSMESIDSDADLPVEIPIPEVVIQNDASHTISKKQSFSPSLLDRSDEYEFEESEEDPSADAFKPGSQEVWEKCFDNFRAEETARSVDDIDAFMSTVNGEETLVLSEEARIVAAGDANSPEKGYLLSLEVLTNGTWLSVVKYEIGEEGSTHQTFDGSYRRSRPLNLPQGRVLELAKNDLSRNWQDHIGLFSI